MKYLLLLSCLFLFAGCKKQDRVRDCVEGAIIAVYVLHDNGVKRPDGADPQGMAEEIEFRCEKYVEDHK